MPTYLHGLWGRRQYERCWGHFTTPKYGEWENGDTSSRYPNICAVKLQRLTPPHQTDSARKHYDVRAAVITGFSAKPLSERQRFGAVCRAVNGGSMSSLSFLIMRGGAQSFKCNAGRLSGHQHTVLSAKTLHLGEQYPWKTLWYPIWTARASRLKMHLWKSHWYLISNNLTTWFGSDLQKLDFTCFFLFCFCYSDLLKSTWIQSGYVKNPLWTNFWPFFVPLNVIQRIF